MRALVTGGSGFVGQWLVDALQRDGHLVHVAAPDGPPGTTAEAVRWHVGDLRDAAVVERVLSESRPDWVFHLAGISAMAEAEADPGLAADTNVTVAVRLLATLAAARRHGAADPVVLVVGSGEQYGRHPESALPLRESSELWPLTLYAASKAAQEVFALQAHRRHGLRVIATRSFNHTGAGQSDRFLLPALVRRALALRGREPAVLRLGNTSPVRDIAHVSDVVRAYILLAERGLPGEIYNVCQGEGHSVREIAERVLRRTGVDAVLEEDPSLVRPVDVPALVGDAGKLRAHTGWAPLRSLDDCIDDLIHAATH